MPNHYPGEHLDLDADSARFLVGGNTLHISKYINK